MGMARLGFVKIVERLFILTMRKSSRYVQDAQLVFPTLKAEIKEVQ